MFIFAPNNTRPMNESQPKYVNSPRHKYRAVLCLRAPGEEEDTIKVFAAPTADQALDRAKKEWRRLGDRDGSHDYVFVWFNKTDYPKFDWFHISSTTLTTSVDGSDRGRPRKPVKPPKVVKHSGGRREGAGRKVYVPSDQKKVNITLSVSPQDKASCAKLREAGINLSEEFSKVVQRLAKIFC